ncbi:MAG: hypothetical protein ACYC0F_19935 [Rhodanobacter sp.]
MTFSLRYPRRIFRGKWMTKQRWRIAAAITCVAATGCSKAGGEARTITRRPQLAGQGTYPLTSAGHLAGAEVALSRCIDHEAPRAAVCPFAAWMDTSGRYAGRG